MGLHRFGDKACHRPIGIRIEGLRQPLQGIAHPAGVTLQDPAARHQVASRPEPRLRIDNRSVDDKLNRTRRPRHRRQLPGLDGACAQESHLSVRPAYGHREVRPQAEMGFRLLCQGSEHVARGEQRGEDSSRQAEGFNNVPGPLPRLKIHQRCFAGLGSFRGRNPRQLIGDPVAQAQVGAGPVQEIRGLVGHPEEARAGEDRGRPVPASLVQLLASLFGQHHRLGDRPSVAIGYGQQGLSGAADEDDAVSHAAGRDPDHLLGPGVCPLHHFARRLTQHAPCNGCIEVELKSPRPCDGDQLPGAPGSGQGRPVDIYQQAARTSAARIQPHEEASCHSCPRPCYGSHVSAVRPVRRLTDPTVPRTAPSPSLSDVHGMPEKHANLSMSVCGHGCTQLPDGEPRRSSSSAGSLRGADQAPAASRPRSRREHGQKVGARVGSSYHPGWPLPSSSSSCGLYPGWKVGLTMCALRLDHRRQAKSAEELVCTWDVAGSPKRHEQLVENLIAHPQIKAFRV